MSAKVVHSDPTPGQFIREIHCWIATYADGTEGIIACGIKGVGIMPLMASHRAQAEALEEAARSAQQAAMHETNRMISIRLVTFTTTEGTRQ